MTMPQLILEYKRQKSNVQLVANGTIQMHEITTTFDVVIAAEQDMLNEYSNQKLNGNCNTPYHRLCQ